MFHRIKSLSRIVGLGIVTLVFTAVRADSLRADNLRGQQIWGHNQSNETVWVAARYYPPGAGSPIDHGFWKLEPGQKMLMFYNDRVWVYFHAHNAQGQDVYFSTTGAPVSGTVHGRTVRMYPVDTGDDYRPRVLIIHPR